VLASFVTATIAGFGRAGYRLAVEGAVAKLAVHS
jgi:3-dehydroquinate dehydratase